MTKLRLIIFDVDGTLIDSQHLICLAMQTAFKNMGLTAPSDQAVRSCIGMSLPLIFPKIAPDLDSKIYQELDSAYRSAFKNLYYERGYKDSLQFFEGMRPLLDQLHAEDHTLLAIATGKSRAGLTRMVEQHALSKHFISLQCADDHPSKPHPSMVEACLFDAGVSPEQALIIGDTTYDMQMGRAAGIGTIGVSWGCHTPEQLQADRIAHHAQEIPSAIQEILGGIS